MTMTMTALKLTLPPFAPYPELRWRAHMLSEEWEACLDAWLSLAEAHLALSSADFLRLSSKDDSLLCFLKTYVAERSMSHDSTALAKARQLRRTSYFLIHRLFEVEKPPELLSQWAFLAAVSKIYGKEHAGKLAVQAWKKNTDALETSVGSIKVSLIKELEAGLKGDLKAAELQLRWLNPLLHASPETASFFMAGDDFVDALISCYKLMNPPLRKVIISTTYLCLIGLTEGLKPNFSTLIDQLYSLSTAAEAHKAGPTNVNDSLVAELVTVTPILKQVQQRIDGSGSGSNRARSVLATLSAFRKTGALSRPLHLIRRKKDKKGKGPSTARLPGSDGQVHVHQMSLISQVQDLFPDLGSAFVVKLLDFYADSAEQVIEHLLESSLPSHLSSLDQSENLGSSQHGYSPDLAPRSTPPLLPVRHNVFDDDELDNLTVSTSRLHFGRRNPSQTADDILSDRTHAPAKAAILSALAAFDSDDDERDDTYDTADVGGTVDSTNPEHVVDSGGSGSANEEVLFRAWKGKQDVFGRDAVTRRSKEREALRADTAMTDEAIEGWGIMLGRDSRQLRRLEAKFSAFKGEQAELPGSAWRDSPEGSGPENNNNDRGRGGRLRGQGRGRAGARGGRGGGNVAGTTGDQGTDHARKGKEANKGSRANHNRRDQRAKKMARGGLPV